MELHFYNPPKYNTPLANNGMPQLFFHAAFHKLLKTVHILIRNAKLPSQTGYNLCRKILEMPKKYVNDKVWGALGKELAGKITKNYSNELDGKINKQLAQETKRK